MKKTLVEPPVARLLELCELFFSVDKYIIYDLKLQGICE